MAGLKDKSDPPSNMNTFKHGLGRHSEARQHRARGKRQAANSKRIDSGQRRGYSDIDGYQDSSGGHSQ